MSEPGWDVERIVREVFQRLGELDGGAAEPAPAAPKDLALTGRLVTLSEVEGRVAAGTLTVPAGAVVTPAARDYLKENNVRLQTGRGASGAAPRRTSLVLAVAGLQAGTFDAAGLVAGLGRDEIEVEQLARAGLVAAIEELTQSVARDGRLGLLLTPETAAALCLANRQRGVRAAAAATTTCVQRGLEAIGTNLLVVNPKGKGQFQLQRLITAFCHGNRQQARYGAHL